MRFKKTYFLAILCDASVFFRTTQEEKSFSLFAKK